MIRRPQDLTGHRFGKLVVVERADDVTYGGRPQAAWTVVCDCGRRESYPRAALVRTDRCVECRRPPCGRCGTLFDRLNPNQRYCLPCQPAARAAHSLAHYYREKARDPGAHREKRRRETALAAARVDEAVRVRRRAAGARYRAKVRADPELAEHARTYHREYARAWRALQRLDPPAYARWVAERREAGREYRREWARERRAAMTDEERAALLLRQRETRRQQALAELLQLANRAEEKKDG